MNSTSDSDHSDSVLEANSSNVYKDGFEFVKRHAVHLAEILPGKLYFATLSKKDDLKTIHEKYYSSYNKLTKKNYRCIALDDAYEYLPYNKDFGPFNLAVLYVYCKTLESHFREKNVVIHCTGLDKKNRVNQAFLIGSYSIIYHQQTPKSLEDRWLDMRSERRISSKAFNKFEQYVHAGFGICRYQLQLQDCLAGVYRAHELKFLDFKTFNVNEYRKHERVENGDFNWIIPKQFIAFGDPETYADNLGVPVSFFVKYFRKKNIRLVVRLNISTYEASNFIDVGIDHHDLIYPDGSIPSESIVRQFLALCEGTIAKGSSVAVHCKAGLGRTGTLIACYIMKHYRFTAQEAIAWLRICRPGSVIGYQQKWLERKQNWLWKLGDQYYGRSLTRKGQSSQASVGQNDNITSDDALDDDLESLMEDINNLGAKLDRTASLLEEEKCGLKDQMTSMTQGDFLNEIKLHRKSFERENKISNENSSKLPKRSGVSIVKRIPVLRSSRTSKLSSWDVNNNLSQQSVNPNNTPPLSQLKLCGKKVTKYSSPARMLPH